MIRPCVCGLVLLATSFAVLPAQIPDSAFKAASASDSAFFFESPVPLDWSAIALSARPDFHPAHPDTNLIRDSYSDEYQGYGWIYFNAPLPASLPRGHYWVLADSGATEVHPRRLSGNIYIQSDTAGWARPVLSYSGSVETPRRRGDHLGEPSFGVFSRLPITIRSKLALVTGTEAQPKIRVLLGSRRIEATLDTAVRGMRPGLDDMPSQARAFEVVETGQAFLSVRWPDEDICYGGYVLYDITTALPRVVAQKHGACGE